MVVCILMTHKASQKKHDVVHIHHCAIKKANKATFQVCVAQLPRLQEWVGTVAVLVTVNGNHVNTIRSPFVVSNSLFLMAPGVSIEVVSSGRFPVPPHAECPAS